MLDLSRLLVAWAAPIFIGIVFTVTRQVDRFNDRASRPFPVAGIRWEALQSFTSDTITFFENYYSPENSELEQKKSSPRHRGEPYFLDGHRHPCLYRISSLARAAESVTY